MPKRFPPRILFMPKDEPTLSSGYGMIGKHIFPRFADRYGKENILILAPVFTKEQEREYQGMRILPGVSWDYGENMLESHWKNQDLDFVITIGDWFQMKAVTDVVARNEIPWIAWAPFDLLQPPEQMVQGILRLAWRVVPWTAYGEAKFKQYLTNVTAPIPLGVDPSLWGPGDRKRLPNVMASLGFEEDAYNILIIGATQRRKYWAEQLVGIGLFRKLNPGIKLRLYFHCHTHQDQEVPIPELVALADLQDVTRYPDQYRMAMGGLTEIQLGAVRNCADVVLNACLEGFGLVQIQAQACGVPVVYLEEGPGTELVVYGAGIPAMGVDYTMSLLKPIPNPVGVASALTELYKFRGQRSEQAVRHIRENYSWDVIAEKWFALLEKDLLPEMDRLSLYVPTPSPLLQGRARREVEIV